MGQQTILRVETGNSNPVLSTDGAYPPVVTTNNVPVYETLDLYKSAPIKINKSYAEIQNIAKKNSDYSIPIAVPGSKKNNRFFETFYNVDSDTLYFDPTKRVACQVLIDDVVYFKGYLKLNKVSIKENKTEYNVTLYSQLGELFGQMGNGLLSDLPYSVTNGWNPDLTLEDVSNPWEESPYREEDINNRRPEKYMFPIVHNGYVYDDDGNVATGTTRLYSSTIVGAWSSPSAAASAGATNYNLNSPTNGLFINQLKPALSVYHLFDFIFDFYGYTLKSDFKETPWFKQLYMYGYFANEDVLMGYKYPKYQSFPLSDVEVIVEYISLSSSYYATIVKKNTKVPCYCDETVELTIRDLCASVVTDKTITIEPFNNPGSVTQGCTPFEPEIVNSNVAISQYSADDFSEGPSYYPAASGTKITYTSGNTLNMNLVIDEEIKQIDFIASVAKKFNLIFTPDLEEPNTIIMEPIPYYMGSGDVLDWSGKLSYDQGFTVEPAQNYIESEIILSDKSDKDGGNSEFERIHNRVYGEKKVYSQTEFRSKSKKIETIFSPEVIRKWDVVSNSGNIDLPLGINYSESSSDGDDGAVTWTYEGLKSKPKLFYYVDNANPFINNTGELFTDPPGGVETFQIKISEPGTSNQFAARYEKIPIISHTSPIGADDDDKINNDSLSILFESERSLNVGVQAFDAYSKFDLYTRFYENPINNLFNKNTRFVKGKFNLNLDDILNIKPNDLIKLKEQYFQWNKIKEYNLTEDQLTDVELIQYNNVLQTYPTRYFNYYYLDNPSAVYRFKTEMTNEELNYTNWGRSVRYDYLQGANGTSNVAVVTGVRDFSQGSNVLVGQNWIEVTEEDYETNGGIDREYDSLYVYSISGAHFSEGGDLNNTFYPLVMGYSSGGTQYDWLNVYTDNADFNSKSSSFGFTTGSSTTHGTITTPTPTPVPTVPAPTPTPYYNTDGALIVTYEPIIDSYYYLLSNANPLIRYEVYLDGVLAQRHHTNVDDFYSTAIQEAQDVIIRVYKTVPATTLVASLIRRDFTNDNEDGDAGIKETSISLTQTDYGDYEDFEFTITLPIENCNYEYRFDVDEVAVTGTTCMNYCVTAEDITRDTVPDGPEFAYIDFYTGEARYGDVIVETEGKCFLYGWSSNDFENSWWRNLIVGPVETQRESGFTNFGEIQCLPSGTTVCFNAVSGSPVSFKEEVVITEIGPCPTPLYGFQNEVNYLYMFSDDTMLWWANPWDYNINKQSPYYLTDSSCDAISGRTSVQDSYDRTVFLMGSLDEDGCVFDDFDPQSGYGSVMKNVGSAGPLIDPRPSIIFPQSDGTYFANRLYERAGSLFQIIAKYDRNGGLVEQQPDTFDSFALYGTLIGRDDNTGKFYVQDGTRIARIESDLQSGTGFFASVPTTATSSSQPRTHGMYIDSSENQWYYGEYGLIKRNPRGYAGDYFGYSFSWKNPNVYGEVHDMRYISGYGFVIGGDFSRIDVDGGVYNRGNIALIDLGGDISEIYLNNVGFNGIVRAIEVQSDGKILIGGDFTEYNGIPFNHLVRLNSDFTIDETFMLEINTAFDDRVNDIKVDSTGDIVVVGAFTRFNNLDANGIVKLDSTGVLQWPLQTFPTPTPGPTQTPLPTPLPTVTPVPSLDVDVSMSYEIDGLPTFDYQVLWRFMNLKFEPYVEYPDQDYGRDTWSIPFLTNSDALAQPLLGELSGNTATPTGQTYTFDTVTGNFYGKYRLRAMFQLDYDDFDGSFSNLVGGPFTLDVIKNGTPVLTGITVNWDISRANSPNDSQVYLEEFTGTTYNKTIWFSTLDSTTDYFEITGNDDIEFKITTQLLKNFGIPSVTPFPTATPTPTPTPTAMPPGDVEI